MAKAVSCDVQRLAQWSLETLGAAVIGMIIMTNCLYFISIITIAVLLQDPGTYSRACGGGNQFIQH